MEPTGREAVAAAREKDRAALEKLRSQMREKDRARAEAAAAEKDAEAKRKAKVAERAAEEASRHDIYMSLDVPWVPADFGQGAPKLTKQSETNIREALQRCRLHSPPLPPDLDAMWALFLDRYPAQLRAQHGSAMGAHFVKELQTVRKKAGAAWEQRKSGAGAPSAAAVGGHSNPHAFAALVRDALAQFVGRIQL